MSIPEKIETLQSEDLHEGPRDKKSRKDKKKSRAQSQSIEGKSPLRIAMGRLVRDKLAMVCLFIVLVFVLIAIFAGVIANFFNVSTASVLPSQYIDAFNGGLPKTGPPLHGYDPEHPFGLAPHTADDNLAYWLYGCRTSLTIATISTVAATLIGVVVGLISGYGSGGLDRTISFITDFFLTIPFLLAALSLAPILNERFADNPAQYHTIKYWSLILILTFFGWMGTARLIRGEVLSLREREFIQSAQVIGMPTWRILSKELLPNLVAPIVISASLMLPAFVTAEAGLAFLGIGVDGASWGQTINKATDYFQLYPLYLWEPLLGIVLLVVALNLLGDAIRDALDPKTRR
ncbi:MAG TPA: ABC transporter permease [Nocardioides sp.]|uniref:ABC transporter permease n=1 Tax=Nocardioides sp. TaxID=35761 RepID=UPI002C80D4B7|nr:ABC transporter permease [Nocardioides sp.]HQR26369.1 ABC transporter permease [Nocardioides sp.]